jgi:IS30 family transposase
MLMHVCHKWVTSTARLTTVHFIHLRSQKQHYRRTRANTLRRRHREAVLTIRRIDRRPTSAQRRSRYSHWEEDTMVSRVNQARIETVVERKSGYLQAFLLTNGSSDSFARKTAAALAAIPAC